MAFERWTAKKVYYYVICAVTLFVLMWGAVDVVSAIFSMTIFKSPAISMDGSSGPQTEMGGDGKTPAGGAAFEDYYQSRMVFDRVGDSLARILIAGGIFIYASLKIKELEGKEI